VIDVGQTAPVFTARTTTGEDMSLADLSGQAVVLYFFPRAFTTICTVEARQFQQAYPKIREAGAYLVGVSPDDHPTQCSFAAETGVEFPMIGDNDGKLADLYGARWPFVRRYRRVTFVIDPAHVVRAVIEHEVRVSLHVEEVMDVLRDFPQAR